MRHEKTTEPLQPETTENIAVSIDTPHEPDPVFGIVVGCKKLNVRAKPDPHAKIVTAIDAGTELRVDSTLHDEFYRVTIPSIDIEGFCMKKYIALK